MEWLFLLPFGLLAIPIVHCVQTAQYKKVIYIGANKFVHESDGIGRHYVWRTDYPEYLMKRDIGSRSWELIHKTAREYFGYDENTIDYFPRYSTRRVAKILNEFLFDKFVAPALNEPLLKKYGE